MTIPTRPVLFRIYPESRRLYFVVAIWATRRDMHTYLAAQGIQDLTWTAGQISAATTGLCRDYKVRQIRPNGTRRLTGKCGEVHLSREDLTIDLAVHELAHAAVNWARRKRIDPFKAGGLLSGNERFCHAAGAFRQFLYHARRRKVELDSSEPR